MTKEEAYDELISPLMSQIIAICKEHKIPCLANFSLDAESGLQCTTTLLDEEWEPSEKMLEAARLIYAKREPLMLTVRDAAGNIKSMEAIL